MENFLQFIKLVLYDNLDSITSLKFGYAQEDFIRLVDCFNNKVIILMEEFFILARIAD